MDGQTFNETILEHFDIIGYGKLPYAEWRKRHGAMTVPDEVQSGLKAFGVDARQEVENVLKEEYWDYLTRGWMKNGE